MAHAHAHGEVDGNYFLDQLFTILTCGGIGLVAILMYQTGMVSRILVPMFYVPLLLGGCAILAMAVVRAVAVWQLAGARNANDSLAHNHEHDHSHSHGHDHSHSHDDHNHAHSHGHEHEHSHGDHNHGHSHGHEHSHDHAHSQAHAHAHGDEEHHEHGWAPWRYMVLAIPVFLYFLGLPREGLSGRLVERSTSQSLQGQSMRGALAALAGGPAFRKTNPERRMTLRFNELTQAAAVPSQQTNYEGDIGILRGQFIPLNNGGDREFTLLRVNRTCCVADEVYLEMRIISPEPIRGVAPYQWVRVEGVISFQKNEKGKWIPVITLNNADDLTTNVEPTTDANIP